MAPKIHPEIVSREIVKPSPNNHPSFHTLSLFDQLNHPFYVPVLFFYTSNKNGDEFHKSNVLKTCLSDALSHYYPLAGRIKDDVTVDCNDEGTLFLEARIASGLSELLKNHDPDTLKVLLPDGVTAKDSTSKSPVVVQVTYFQCGGMSIGLCLCHKILDMASMTYFIYDWASLARKSGDEICPEFNAGSLYPPLDLPILKQYPPVFEDMKDCVDRRLVFHGPKIDKLKEMVADQVEKPTRVEVVASLLFKSAISANAKARKSGSVKPSVLYIPMNLRNKVAQLSERHRGNILGTFKVPVRDEREIELGLLVKQFRKVKAEYADLCASKTNSEDLCPLITELLINASVKRLNVDHDVYSLSSFCRYPFYGADFGWGKPLWVTFPTLKVKNVMFCFDTKQGDGIDVYIILEEKAMSIFENDQELLSFCSINPSVLDTCV